MLHQVRVDREVILSAGAFDSPKLLMLSGIGDAAHLQALGISSICRVVGQNLQDHVVVSVVYQATQNLQAPVVSGKLDYFCIARGMEATPDLQFFFGPIQFLPPGYTPSDFSSQVQSL